MTVDLLPDGFQTGAGESYGSIAQAAGTLKAALGTKALELPVPVAQLWVAKDPYGTPPDNDNTSPIFGQNGAIGLYIVLCVLSGGEYW